jgi:hypothetical protein
MDNVKAKKLTTLISKLTIAANKSVAKKTVATEPRSPISLTGLSGVRNFEHRNLAITGNLLRGQL